MPNRSKDDLIAAYHEVGHTVGACLLGVPVADIVLADPGSGEGLAHAPLTIGEIRERNLRWANAVVAMLGRATERLVFGRANRRYLQEDAETLTRLYRTFLCCRDELPGVPSQAAKPDDGGHRTPWVPRGSRGARPDADGGRKG